LERKIAAQISGRHDQVLVGDLRNFLLGAANRGWGVK
jgi:hypothetical protein